MKNKEISEIAKRRYLIEIISSYLKTNIALMEYFHANATDRKSKLTCNNSIKSTKEAIAHLQTIKHIEILDYIYSSLIGNSVIAYAVSGRLVTSKKLAEWDTEDGFVEFQKEMEDKKAQRITKEQERIATQKAVEQAKKEGKKVEMVWDKDKKTVKPMIIDDKNEA